MAELHFFTGTMDSGKSTLALQTNHNHAARGRVGRIFTTNHSSLALARRCGFYDVGIHRRHGRLSGEWKDVLLVERLMGSAED